MTNFVFFRRKYVAKIEINILRSDPEKGEEKEFVTYSIEKNNNSTILEGLLRVYETNDSTLAFSYGCRVKNCGLCAVNADGKPRYACLTKIKDGMNIAPLENLPIIKDLVFDRKPFFNFLDRFKPYVVREKDPETLPEILNQPSEHTMLMSCRECFGCMSTCPKYNHGDDSFGGPLAFVKIAQLHYDCRDSLDRALQAKEMGIKNCINCRQCVCILGMPIYEIVIKHFLKILEGKDTA